MTNETVENLWRSLGNDGLTALFESSSRPGVLGTILSAIGLSESSTGNRSRLGERLSVSNGIGQSMAADTLSKFSLVGVLLRTLLGGAETEQATSQPARYSMPAPPATGR